MTKKSLRLGKGRSGKRGGNAHKARVARRRDRVNQGRGGSIIAKTAHKNGR